MSLIDKIQDYLDGDLLDAEKTLFESELLTNSNLKNQYENALLAKEISSGLLEIDMRETLAKEEEKRSNLFYGIIALLLLVFIGLFIYFNYFRKAIESPLYALEYEEPLWPGVRGANDELSKVLYELRQGEDVQLVKVGILMNDDLSIESKKYWITEAFLFNGEVDSAMVYLPEFSKDHRKYQRVIWLKTYLKL